MSNLWNPIKYEERYFWSLKELIIGNAKEYNLGASRILDFIRTKMGDYLSPVITGYGLSITWTNSNYPLVLDLVVKRFKDMYCFYTNSEDYPTDEAINFIDKLLNLLYMTSPRYLKLLSIYAAADTTLLDPVEITSSGTTRFNDTPQDSGDFATDSHTTNITEDSRTTSNDLDTKMGRIREIESNYNNILLNWSNEFESLFLEEANI